MNSLLKFIEEPPKATYAILTTKNISKVIPTIRSRCQELSIHYEENVNYISICVTNQNADLSYIKTNIYKEVGPSPDTGSAEKNNFSKILLGLLF